MTTQDAWQDFLIAAQGGAPARVPVALPVDSGYIASAFGMNTLDFFMYPDRWLNAYLTLIARFPEAVLLPGLWVEFGPATETSAFGAPILWRHDRPPAIRPLSLPPADWGSLPRPDPHTDGLMALTLRRYWNLEHHGELPEPHRIRFVAAQGPFAIATHLFGASVFLDAVGGASASTPVALDALDIMTDTTIRFLRAQLGCLRAPAGVLVIDDTVGMLSSDVFERLAVPLLGRVFDTFDGMIRIFRCDTPCDPLLPLLPDLNFEVFHFNHTMDMESVRAALHPKAVMGNIAPLGVMAHGTPAQVMIGARNCLDRANPADGLILSTGGSLHPDTPAENIDTLIDATFG
jgi:hypothetical protein